MSKLEVNNINASDAILSALTHNKPIAVYGINGYLGKVVVCDGAKKIIESRQFDDGFLTTPVNTVKKVYDQNGELPITELNIFDGNSDSYQHAILPNDMLLSLNLKQVTLLKNTLRDNLSFLGLAIPEAVDAFRKARIENYRNSKSKFIADIELKLTNINFDWLHDHLEEDCICEYLGDCYVKLTILNHPKFIGLEKPPVIFELCLGDFENAVKITTAFTMSLTDLITAINTETLEVTA